MTLNITKKKIEKVLELFNHPQTRKIRKNRGKKRRRNNKSFNRKNGRKNLATSTLKKRGGHAGHHPPLLNGGTVGVVLGGQVGGDIVKMKQNFQNFITKFQPSLKNKYDNYEVVDNNPSEDTNDDKKKKFLGNILMNLKSTFGNTKKEGEEVVSPFYDNDGFKNIISNNSGDNSDDNSSLLKVLLEVNKNEDNNNIGSLPKEELVMLEDIVFPIQLPILPEDNSNKMNPITTGDSTIFTPGNVGDPLYMKQNASVKITESETNPEETPEETKKEEPKSKEIDSSDMLKVALASNYFTQYGILSGMLKINQEKDKDKFDVMNFVQDPKLYAEFCNKMGFQFAEMKGEVNEETSQDQTEETPQGQTEETPQGQIGEK